MDATREHLAAELSRDLDATEAQVLPAEAEVTRIEAQVAHVEDDYLSGQISGQTFEQFSARLSEQHEAAVAERDRLTAHVAEIREARQNIDAESETLRRLAALRDTVAGHLRDASQTGDVDALRGVVAGIAEHVYVDRTGRITLIAPGVRLLEDGHPPMTYVGGPDRELYPTLCARRVTDEPLGELEPLDRYAIPLGSGHMANRRSSRV